MSGIWMKGRFTCKNPQKYKGGDLSKIVFRSSWEKAFMTFCDVESDIIAWNSEIVTINYFDPVQNKNRRYFVDFQILTKNADGSTQVTLVEIKPYKQTLRPRANSRKSQKTMTDEANTYATNIAKWTAAKALCAEKAWKFTIITERELFGGIDKGFKPPRRT